MWLGEGVGLFRLCPQIPLIWDCYETYCLACFHFVLVCVPHTLIVMSNRPHPSHLLIVDVPLPVLCYHIGYQTTRT
jgi:hypothetical protein